MRSSKSALALAFIVSSVIGILAWQTYKIMVSWEASLNEALKNQEECTYESTK